MDVVAQTLDPGKAADALSSGNGQTVLAWVAVALALALGFVVKLLVDSYKAQIADGRENGRILAENAAALRGLTDLIKTLSSRSA